MLRAEGADCDRAWGPLKVGLGCGAPLWISLGILEYWYIPRWWRSYILGTREGGRGDGSHHEGPVRGMQI